MVCKEVRDRQFQEMHLLKIYMDPATAKDRSVLAKVRLK